MSKMAPKHRRIKRATVLTKRTRCLRSKKNRNFSPIYQKLKVNNHSLAIALTQEKEENQILFARNVELLGEVQDLVHACNNRDHVIRNVLKNTKEAMQMLVKMSGFLTNTISSCQEFVLNQNQFHRTSSSSVGKRDSTRISSTKSPARGVVKPMVSGHTITKPTINLSRVNMQGLQNVNLSIIEEGPSTPERNLQRLSESRHSQTLPERASGPAIRIEDEENRVIMRRRTNRYSGGRLSSELYSRRNSGRLSGAGLTNRLSKRSADFSESVKSPRVTLQDVSRYLRNNQTVNIRSLSENANSNEATNMTSVEDSHMSEESSPESSNAAAIPETQESGSGEYSESDDGRNTVIQNCKSPEVKSDKKSSCRKQLQNRSSTIIESDLIDPLEGPSWLYSSSEPEERETEETASPILCMKRRKNHYFRIAKKSADSKNNFSNNDSEISNSSRLNLELGCKVINVTTNDSLQLSNSFHQNNKDDAEEDDDDHRQDLRFITQRRGTSIKSVPERSTYNELNVNLEEDDEETLMLNMQSQLRPQLNDTLEQPERMKYDINELLQLSPLKSLLNIKTNIGPTQVEEEPENTVTLQITQTLKPPDEKTTIKLHRFEQPDASRMATVRAQEQGGNDASISEATTVRLSSAIELPRLTDIMNESEDDTCKTLIIQSPEISKRRKLVMRSVDEAHSASEDNEETPAKSEKKIPKIRKKKSKDKDPSTAKVVLQKLSSIQDESCRIDRKNSEAFVISSKSLSSRLDQSSDSESSIASSNGKQIVTRPRRQKAPKNLQEPNLMKKLRREK